MEAANRIRLFFSKTNSKFQGSDKLFIDWKLKKSNISNKYFKALQIAESTNYIYKRDRFYNFPQLIYDRKKIVDEININIGHINKFYPNLINFEVSIEMKQDEMNRLHVFFEKHRGPLLNPSEYYATAPIEIREAFDNLNLLIHRYEDMGYSNRQAFNEPKMHITFGLNEIVKRYPLADEDFSEFTFEKKFGTWLINYCEVGKPLHDVWRDQDQHIGKEAILPLRYYSADGLIIFGKDVSEDINKRLKDKFYQWWDLNTEKLANLGFYNKFELTNAVGNISVAELDRESESIKNLNNNEIIELLSNYQYFLKIQTL